MRRAWGLGMKMRGMSIEIVGLSSVGRVGGWWLVMTGVVGLNWWVFQEQGGPVGIRA